MMTNVVAVVRGSAQHLKEQSLRYTKKYKLMRCKLLYTICNNMKCDESWAEVKETRLKIWI